LKIIQTALLWDETNKSLPAPDVPEKTEFERFGNFFRAVIAVPNAIIEKEEAKWKRARKKREKKSI
jgi:hypothetical protein